jgi:hypothetical protein
MMIVGDIDHVIRVDGTEWGETVSDNGKQGDQHAVDDVNNIDLPTANVDPADEEQYPGKTEEGDERGIECDGEAQCWWSLVVWT